MGKLQAVQDEIGEVTDMMRANIEAVVDRGEYRRTVLVRSSIHGVL